MGSATLRAFQSAGFTDLLTRAHSEIDLEDRDAVEKFFRNEKPAAVVLAAAKVGGILANNSLPYDFIARNLRIQSNVIQSALDHGIQDLLFLGSSCIYPKLCPQPMKEEFLLTGPLESTNRPYALAKIAGIELCWAANRQFGTRYIAAMPTNMYGPGDNYDLAQSHVLPALIRKMHEAKTRNDGQVVVWGTGNPRREFLFSDDLAKAAVHLLTLSETTKQSLCGENLPLVNVGCGQDLSIAELAEMIRSIVDYNGEIVYDKSKPDGTPRKLLDVSKIKALGWQPSISLRTGIELAYRDFLTRCQT